MTGPDSPRLPVDPAEVLAILPEELRDDLARAAIEVALAASEARRVAASAERPNAPSRWDRAERQAVADLIAAASPALERAMLLPRDVFSRPQLRHVPAPELSRGRCAAATEWPAIPEGWGVRSRSGSRPSLPARLRRRFLRFVRAAGARRRGC